MNVSKPNRYLPTVQGLGLVCGLCPTVAGNWGHTEPVSPKVIITFVLGFALAFAAGWYFIEISPHSGR